MKKVELESMLMEPEGLKRLADRAATIKQKYGLLGETQGRPAFKIRSLEPLTYETRPTVDEIRKNDLDHLNRSGLIVDITRFIPQIAQADPKSALKAIIGKTRKEFSKPNQILLEGAINRVSSQNLLDNESKKLIKEAIQVLESVGMSEKEKEVGK